jgi:hypothetical protein
MLVDDRFSLVLLPLGFSTIQVRLRAREPGGSLRRIAVSALVNCSSSSVTS